MRKNIKGRISNGEEILEDTRVRNTGRTDDRGKINV